MSTQVYMPEHAATAEGPGGEKMIFFYVPQLASQITALRDDPPRQVTYRWAYHPVHKAQVFLAAWDTGVSMALMIPDEAADLLAYMEPEVDLYITLEPVHERLVGDVPAETVQAAVLGRTVGIHHVQFARM